MQPDDAHSKHSHPNYLLIWGILLALLVVSIIGPMVGNLTVLLITAFGIAVVKAVMVGAYFMHLNIERRYIWYLLLMCVLFLAVLFAGVAPDVMKKEGTNWQNVSGPAPVEAAHDAHAPAHH
ncbi:MAG TPA: caa(3)-type oxidase subunit IV [Verrucomicrobiales bacterium]|nr:caa(3)-type oxidase subunit IV [Verrucomicrobiales bacterium]